MKTHLVWIDDVDRLDLLLKLPCPGPLVTLKAEFDVFGGKGIAIVKFDPLPQLEVIG
jgi:hypothetical protein